MKKKEFFVKDWLKIDHKPQAPITKPVIESSLEEQIDALVSAVESASVDIAPSYDDWRDLGFALADTLGEGGRSYYHRLSRFYPSYDEAKTDKQFDACLKAHGSGITINTLFYLAKQASVKSPKSSISPKSAPSPSDDFNTPLEEAEDIEDIGEIEDISQPEEELPTFSQDVCNLLPKLLYDIVRYADSPQEADVLILGAIVTISACLPNISGIYDGHNVYSNLFLFVAAMASGGKGRLPLCQNLVKPIEISLKKLYKAEMAEYKQKLNEYAIDSKNNEQPKEPAERRLFIPANSSATAIYQALNENNQTGLIFETEGDTMANSFKSDYGNFSDGFRKAFHHERISYIRRKDRESVELDHPCLSAVLSGSPGQIFNLIQDTENGLFSRFIFYLIVRTINWKDVFANNEDLNEVFEQFGYKFFDFYQTLKQSSPIRFSLSGSQQKEFNAFFEQVQSEYYILFGNDIVASVRRLGLITFRIAMILTALRLMDGKDIAPVVVCSDTDFYIVITIVKALLQHTAKIYSILPSATVNLNEGNLTVVCQRFYKNLPIKFDRKTYQSIAKKLFIKSKTADKHIARFCEKGLLQHLEHDCYLKP